MRVSVVTMQFPYHHEPWSATDLRALIRLGVDVRVHALRPARPDRARTARELGVAGIPVSHYSVRSGLRGMARGVRHPRRLLRLLGAIAVRCARRPRQALKSLLLVPRALDVCQAVLAERPDVTHLYWGHYPSLVGHLLQHEPGAPPVTLFLGSYDLEERYGVTAPVAARAGAVFTHSRNRAPRVTSVSGGSRTPVVVHRGVERGRFVPRGSPDRGRLVSVGKLIERKGFEDLLEMMLSVRRRWPQATLRVIGEGSLERQLLARARELDLAGTVEFLGPKPHTAVAAELARSELFVLLSHRDWLPNAVKEAMLVGCPCVVSDTEGIRELIDDGESGWVVPIGDPSAAAERVCEALADPVRLSAVRRRARERVERDFDVDRCMSAYRDVWQRLSAAGRA